MNNSKKGEERQNKKGREMVHLGPGKNLTTDLQEGLMAVGVEGGHFAVYQLWPRTGRLPLFLRRHVVRLY